MYKQIELQNIWAKLENGCGLPVAALIRFHWVVWHIFGLKDHCYQLGLESSAEAKMKGGWYGNRMSCLLLIYLQRRLMY